MSEYEDVFRRKELHDMYTLGEARSLDELYLLEDVALTIKELNKKVDFYKDYKKKKKQDVDDAIKVLGNKVDFYKSIMVLTLQKNKEKSIKFPGSCSISSRNQKAKWEIKDEEEFIAVLKEAQKAGEKIDDVLEEVIQYKIKKTPANKMLFMWEQSGKLEGFLKKVKKEASDIVNKVGAKTSVSISFVEKEEEDEGIIDIEVPVKPIADTAEEDYDSI